MYIGMPKYTHSPSYACVSEPIVNMLHKPTLLVYNENNVIGL